MSASDLFILLLFSSNGCRKRKVRAYEKRSHGPIRPGQGLKAFLLGEGEHDVE